MQVIDRSPRELAPLTVRETTPAKLVVISGSFLTERP